MALIKLLPDEAPNVVLTTPEAVQSSYQSQFQTLIPEANVTGILRYIEGYPWTVNYYGQLLNKDNSVNSFDPNTVPLLQPYYKVNGLVVKVNSALSSSYDNETGVTTVSGTGLLPYSIRPNVGDAFIANVDSGEDAVFTINTVERMTYRKETVYQVTYTLTFYLSNSGTWLGDIENRVQQTFYYSEETSHTGKGELVIPTVHEAIKLLKRYMYSSTSYYLDTFFNRQHSTILIPGQVNTMLDPLLVKFLLRTFNTDQHLNIRKIASYNHSGDIYLDQPSIWDMLLKKQPDMLGLVNKKYRFISSMNLPTVSRLGSLGITGIHYVIYPSDATTAAVVGESISYSSLTSVTAVDVVVKNHRDVVPTPIEMLLFGTVTGTTVSKPLLHTLFNNDYYVVSENFYKYMEDNTDVNASSISYIELLIANYLNSKAIAKEDLVMAIKNYMKWPLLQQLYLLPVLWVIIRSQGINVN